MQLKRRYLAAAVPPVAAAAVIGMAPIAHAAPTACVSSGAHTTVCQSPGNASVSTAPQIHATTQYPWFLGGLAFHHGGHRGR
jgi:hypothetical protein